MLYEARDEAKSPSLEAQALRILREPNNAYTDKTRHASASKPIGPKFLNQSIAPSRSLEPFSANPIHGKASSVHTIQMHVDRTNGAAGSNRRGKGVKGVTNGHRRAANSDDLI